MAFAAPLWLAALAALALPLLIHLLSRGHQRRVRVGSVRLMQPAAGRRGRRPRLTEPGLLALRACLLAALALALAGPRWPAAEPRAEEPPGWVLVAPDAARELADDAALAAHVARLRREGYQVRRLEPGLRPGLPSANAAPEPDRPPRARWSLLREADELAPVGAPFVVFAGARADDLDGVRPSFRRRVEWRAIGVESGGAAAVGDQRGTATAAPNPDPHAPSRPLAVAIAVVPERAGEERYLRAAFAAISEDGGAGIAIRTAAADDPVALSAAVGTADLVFWLSDGPPPAVVVDRIRGGGVAVVAGAGEAAPCDRLLLAGIGGLEHRVAVRRCPLEAPTGAPVWRDDGGAVRLSVESLGTGLRFRHAGGFEPAAGDLVVSAAFPEWIRELSAVARRRAGLPAAAGGGIRWPRSGVAGSQAEPRVVPLETGAGAAPNAVASRDASRFWWLLVVLLLAAERLIAGRRRA